ncbi:hypothetical protein [Rhizobium croatiense]|uniref:hypothetical protein n=1 Tax=Rhizobium croatiense TaxID=2867516 RepID=UPI001FEE8E39|nr:hypothetical protein [Rhizobium croatiense]
MSGRPDELVSFFGEGLKLTKCSPAVTKAYKIAAASGATLWDLYPELLDPDQRSMIEAVLAGGLPRNIAIGGSPGKSRSVLVSVLNGALGSSRQARILRRRPEGPIARSFFIRPDMTF